MSDLLSGVLPDASKLLSLLVEAEETEETLEAATAASADLQERGGARESARGNRQDTRRGRQTEETHTHTIWVTEMLHKRIRKRMISIRMENTPAYLTCRMKTDRCIDTMSPRRTHGINA